MRSGLIFLYIAVFSEFNIYCQHSDTIIGKEKRVREKVIFLTELENPQLIYYDDYGHYGFRGPETTQSVFKDYWYNRESCYFINYERFFDKRGNVIKDLWFTKGDTLISSYTFTYDEKNRLKKEVNFTNDGIIFYEDYFYSGDEQMNIINYNSENDFLFWHTYKKYDEDDNLILERKILDDGYIYQYDYTYKNGKCKDRTNSRLVGMEKLKNFKKEDSLEFYYKDIINTINSNGQIVTHKEYQRIYRNGTPKIEPKVTVLQEFDGGNLLQKSVAYNTRDPFYTNFEYDDQNRLTARYCCSKKKEDAVKIKQYEYKNYNIYSLRLTQHDKDGVEVNNVEFSYKFDEKGNWIEILKTVDGVERFKWVRTIEFYE